MTDSEVDLADPKTVPIPPKQKKGRKRSISGTLEVSSDLTEDSGGSGSDRGKS